MVAPAAQADHEGTAGTGWPDAGATHETRPGESASATYGELIGTNPASVCEVSGLVETDEYQGFIAPNGSTLPFLSGDGPQHTDPAPEVGLAPGVINNPSHTHFFFQNVALQCSGEVSGLIEVVADGGNDGHIDSTTDHAINDHHGSVTLSAWSNSSEYNNGTPCSDPPSGWANKGDITASFGGDTANGWVKYDRVANYVKSWGQFLPDCSTGVASGDRFWSDLILSPEIDPDLGPTGAFVITGVARIYN
jgi:hypothetical protein